MVEQYRCFYILNVFPWISDRLSYQSGLNHTWGSSHARSRAARGPGRSPSSGWHPARYWSPGWWCWKERRSSWSRPAPTRPARAPSGTAATSGTAPRTYGRQGAAPQRRSWKTNHGELKCLKYPRFVRSIEETRTELFLWTSPLISKRQLYISMYMTLLDLLSSESHLLLLLMLPLVH